MEPYPYLDAAVAAFVVIPAVLVVVLVAGVRMAWVRSGATPGVATTRALAIGAVAIVWMALTWGVARSGLLRDWNRTPPPFFMLALTIVTLAGAFAFSGVGRRVAAFVPLWALVGIQAFRLPLEIAMHSMYERGIMPEVMTYTGRNFDIVTGATAILVSLALFIGRAGRALVLSWNIVGLALLVNVVTVAILATPRVRYFGDEQLNTWVTYPPFVWLPAVLVLAALAGHLVIFRSLWSGIDGGAKSRRGS